MESKIFREETFAKAYDFVDALRLTNPRWSFHKDEDSAWVRGWYFRGQGDATWPLLPSVLRQLDTYHPLALMKKHRKGDEKRIAFLLESKYQENKVEKIEDIFQAQVQVCFNVLCEYSLIKEFVRYADEIGHPVPSFSEFECEIDFVEYYLDSLFGGGTSEFWMSYPVVLAQHHGIPTRLLDWTSRPLIAAYFAAYSVPDKNSGFMAVYAISDYVFENTNIRRISIPRNLSSYLHAQSGILSYDLKIDGQYVKRGKHISIEESLPIDLPGVLTEYTRLHKLILPVSEVGELLRLLWLEGISIAHLMPSLDNVSEALKLKWRFAKTRK